MIFEDDESNESNESNESMDLEESTEKGLGDINDLNIAYDILPRIKGLYASHDVSKPQQLSNKVARYLFLLLRTHKEHECFLPMLLMTILSIVKSNDENVTILGRLGIFPELVQVLEMHTRVHDIIIKSLVLIITMVNTSHTIEKPQDSRRSRRKSSDGRSTNHSHSMDNWKCLFAEAGGLKLVNDLFDIYEKDLSESTLTALCRLIGSLAMNPILANKLDHLNLIQNLLNLISKIRKNPSRGRLLAAVTWALSILTSGNLIGRLMDASIGVMLMSMIRNHWRYINDNSSSYMEVCEETLECSFNILIKKVSTSLKYLSMLPLEAVTQFLKVLHKMELLDETVHTRAPNLRKKILRMLLLFESNCRKDECDYHVPVRIAN